MTRRAFTLIELLVVTAIIGLLVGLLLPVLASARDAAVGASCLANQSQLMVGVHAYAVDHRGVIPFGPEERKRVTANVAGVATGADDFYVIDGMITSLISTKQGEHAGAGLLLNGYLDGASESLFCPGADQPLVARDQLDQVGVGTAISGYLYRHGSNTFADSALFRLHGEPLDDHIRLDDLGDNRRGEPMRALFVDNNMVVAPGSFYADLFNRSNHDLAYANIAYADGHAETRNNALGRYQANGAGKPIYKWLSLMLDVFEEADRPD